MMQPRPSPKGQPDNPALRKNLADGREYLENLRRTLVALKNRGEDETPEYQQLVDITNDVAGFVKEAWLKLNQAYIVPPDAVSSRIQAGDLRGAAEIVSTLSRDRIQSLQQCLNEFEQLEKIKPVALPSGTNLAAIGPGKLEMEGMEPPAYWEDFQAAHPLVDKLAMTQPLQSLIRAGDHAAKAQLAVLTTIAEYGDRLIPPFPEIRIRPPADSPFLPVYDRVKKLLESFQDSRYKVNLLSPGRVSQLIRADRESSIKDLIGSMLTHYALKNDAPTIATELRNLFETYIHTEFSPTSESQALREKIQDVLQAENINFSEDKANLLMNPHLSPDKCIADLAVLINNDNPQLTSDQCTEQGIRIKEQISNFNRNILQEWVDRLYLELGGDPSLFSIQVDDTSTEESTVSLGPGNETGLTGYNGLLNYKFIGRVIIAPTFSIGIADAFNAGNNTIKEGAQLLPDQTVSMITGFLRNGADFEFSELVAKESTPTEPADPGMIRVGGECRIDPDRSRGTVKITIHSFTEAEPCPKYKSDRDPTGRIGLSQDRAILSSLHIVAALRREFPSDPTRQDRLKKLESDLQMKLIQPPVAASVRSAG